MAGYAVMDEALVALLPYGPDLSNSFTNHAPMAIEAMCAMGRGDAALPWLESLWPNRSRLVARSEPKKRMVDWQKELGGGQSEDWVLFFAEVFSEDHWREDVARWTARLVPGISAAALHGFIRVGHAVRSVSDAATPQRLHELRGAFAYWASHYQALPEAAGVIPPSPAGDAILRIKRVALQGQRRAGSITAALKVLETDFAPTIALLDVSRPVPLVLSELTKTFAAVYLANAVDGMGVITFIHAVTGPVALRSLLSVLPEATSRRVLRYLWQASCALYAALGVADPVSSVRSFEPIDQSELFDRAIATADEHAIKFTEALLRENALDPSPIYLAAASHAINALT